MNQTMNESADEEHLETMMRYIEPHFKHIKDLDKKSNVPRFEHGYISPNDIGFFMLKAIILFIFLVVGVVVGINLIG